MQPDPAKKYSHLKLLSSLGGFLFSIIFLFFFQFSEASPALKRISFGWGGSIVPSVAIYVGIFSLSFWMVLLPFRFYRGFLLEHRFSLSTQGFPSWLVDQLKELGLSLPITILMMEIFYYLVNNFASYWWIYASLLYMTFSVFVAYIFPVVVIPIFYKLGPLSDKGLENRILDLARRARLKIQKVRVMDYSRRTKKANAFFAGLWRSRQIVLGDTLLEGFTQDQIEVVLAHEMGHQQLGHLWKMTLLHAATMALALVSVQAFFLGPGAYWGVGGLGDLSNLPLVFLISTLVLFFLSPAKNAFSRFWEKQADLFSLGLTGKSEAFVSFMEDVAKRNLADKNPHPLIEFLFYTHPSISRRISLARGK